jgi:hypothetical protein
MIGTNYRHTLILIILACLSSTCKAGTKAVDLEMLVVWLMIWRRKTQGVLSCDLGVLENRFEPRVLSSRYFGHGRPIRQSCMSIKSYAYAFYTGLPLPRCQEQA